MADNVFDNFGQGFYDKLYDAMARSDMIGYDNTDQAAILSSAYMLVLVGLKKDSPRYTGNLQNRGITGYDLTENHKQIIIDAPGITTDQGEKLPNYGWQTDILPLLIFKNKEGELLFRRNKNIGWVENSVRSSLALFLNKHQSSFNPESIGPGDIGYEAMIDTTKQLTNNVIGGDNIW